MIRFEHLSKTFQTKDGAFEALKDVSFEIEKGDIYGRHRLQRCRKIQP